MNLINSFYRKIVSTNLLLICGMCLFTNCVSQKSIVEQTVQAQTNTDNKNNLKSENVDFLNPSVDLCRFKSSSFLQTGDGEIYKLDKQIYELTNAGFPEEISIEDAAAIFNKMELCYQTGRQFVPLKAADIVNAVNREVCKNYQQTNDANLCYKRKEYVERGKLPKGSFLFAETVKDKKTDKIWLYQELDKHRRDLVGELIFPFLVREAQSSLKTK